MSTSDLTDDALTDAVVASFDGAPGDRYREVMTSLVRHLHAFLRDVSLTEEEWFQGIRFLTRTGDITTDVRQEFILLSDVLGASMQTIGINHPHPEGATESTVFGPFFVAGAPEFASGDDLSGGAVGHPCHVSGRILDTAGDPVPGAVIDVWQADDDGFYDVQRDELDAPQGRGRLRAGDDGAFAFWTVMPVAYPIPADGPVGDLLTAAGRGPMRPAHIHFRVEADGFDTLITHIFAAGDPYLDTDAVFGVKGSLIAEFAHHDAGPGPGGRALDEPYRTLERDLVLATTAEVAS